MIIKNKVLEKLEQDFLKAKHIIIRAINERRPIVIKHHADCDGYSGAIALEKVILPLIKFKHKQNAWIYYKRQPMRAPYYDYSDCVRDLSFFLNDCERFNVQTPLIILVDNGSANEDILSLKKLKIYDFQIIIIDHHMYDKEVTDIVDVFINSRYAGDEDGKITAGMLGVELAQIIYNKFEDYYLGVIAGYGDKCFGEVFDAYLKKSKALGYDEIFMKKLSEVIDFEAFYLSSFEAHQLIDDLFGKNKDIQEKIVDLLYNDIIKKIEETINTAKQFLEVESKKDIIIASIDLRKSTTYGYPSWGKTIGIIFDELKEEYKDKDILMFGYTEDSIIIRINNLSKKLNGLDEIIKALKEKFPNAMIKGGGHKTAGTIKFIPAYKNKILDDIINII